MPGRRNDIDHLLGALNRLKARVEDLGESPDAAPDLPSLAPMALLQAALNELDQVRKSSEVPQLFSRFAARTGLRMLVLKRWRSGLQVVAERNASLPAEARRKQPNGKAPIPCDGDDIFALAGRERQVYAGPVPVKVFPIDLTLLLGRGASERRIVILPLPARARWSTFIYLDGDTRQQAALAVAESLARHAVDRLRLLQLGEAAPQGEVASVLRAEMNRRQQREPRAPGATDRAPSPSLGPRVAPADGPEPDLDLEWLTPTNAADDAGEAPRDAAGPPPSAPATEPLRLDPGEPVADAVPRTARLASQARAEADAIVEAWESALLTGPGAASADRGDTGRPPAPMAPEDVLHQSGDLPAMPKAALHILSVIEDPRTTATRLEKAVATDQALTAKILRIANSPFYGAVREINTVSEAIVRLGFVTIRNWTLVTATRSVFLGAGASVLFQKIWRQSVLSAMAAQLVAQAVQRSEPETVFVGGLMQNIGQLVLARSHPELFQQVLSISAEEQLPYHVVEQELLGFDHGDLGALLIKEWNLSEDLEQAVRWHHRLDHPDIACPELAAMIALGEEVAACSGSAEGDTDVPDSLEGATSRAATVLALSPEFVRRLRVQARDLSVDSSLFA